MTLAVLPEWITLTSTLVMLPIGLALLVTVLVQRQRLAASRRARDESETNLTKFSSAVMNSGAMIIITDSDGRIEFVNERFCELTRFNADEMLGQSLAKLSAIVNLNGTETGVTTNFLDCLQPHWKGELLCQTNGATPLWTAVTTSSVLDEHGDTRNYIVSAVDITDLKIAHRRMEQLALFDSLTGLANRRLFQDRLEQALQSVRRRGNQLAIFFLDLDDFKRVNDSMGHDAGDMLLLTVAERLKACVRGQDTVARLGGDEFTILLHDVSDPKDMTMIAENILASLKAPIRLNQQEVLISTSIGITTAPSDGDRSETLMKNADLALYRAKDKGRDQYDFFTSALNQRAVRLMNLERELRHGLRQDEFSLLFQPQVDLSTGTVSSLEALVRWQHPQRGEVMPDEFIPVAEDTGLIVPLGNWVLQNACMQIKLLQQLTGQQLRVAVNLSPRQFRDPALEGVVDHALSASGLRPESLELEVTESMLMDDIAAVSDQLGRLKARGVTITIDDFGTGYSSLRHLKHLPVDCVKIDEEFIMDIPDNRDNIGITNAVISIARELDLKVVAEGVECGEQEYYLRDQGCDIAQGYYFGAPMTFESAYRFFSTQGEQQMLKA